MADLETIKDRVRKLMAVAGDGIATDGEIGNAVALAEKLIAAHHLQPEDYQAKPEDAPENVTMGDARATMLYSRMTTWESTLSHAICGLFGSVQCYRTHDLVPLRVNGVAVRDEHGNIRYGKQLVFYGPASEAAEAAELYALWSCSIAAMAVARWGGCFVGNGALYCYGFTTAILQKVRALTPQRQIAQAKPLMIDGKTTGAITLAGRYEMLRNEGRKWLEETKGFKLRSGTRRAGYTSGDHGAFEEGRRHGAQSGFGRKASRNMLCA